MPSLNPTAKVKNTIKGPESRTKNGYKSGPDGYKSKHKTPFNVDKRLEDWSLLYINPKVSQTKVFTLFLISIFSESVLLLQIIIFLLT